MDSARIGNLVEAGELLDQTGLDVCFQRNGGFHLALGDDELEQREGFWKRLHNQPGSADYRMEILNRDQVAKMLPHIGPEVSGGSFCRSTVT